MFRPRNPFHKCNHYEQRRFDKLKRRWPWLPAFLIVGHLMVHEVPMILLGTWALTEHCHHHHDHSELEEYND